MRSSSPERARPYAFLAGLGLAAAATGVIAGQVHADPRLNALTDTISDYAATDRGGAVESGMFLCGLASLLLLAALHFARAPLTWLGRTGLAVWGSGLMLAAFVPTDPQGVPLTLTGQVHRYASVTAFVALLMACGILGRRMRTHPVWRGQATAVRRLTLLAGAGGLAMAISAAVGHRLLIGLAERVLTAAQVAVLLLLAFGLSRRVQEV